PVQTDDGAGDPGPEGDRELATGRGVHAEPFLVDPSRDGDGQERLAGVVDVCPGQAALGRERGRERLGEGAGASAQVVLVQDVRGRSVLGRDLTQVRAGDGEGTVPGAAHPGGPHATRCTVRFRRGHDAGGAVRGTGRAGHIRSGALTPSSARPLRSTWVVASLSHSRAVCTGSTGSSPRGVTRHCWYQV